MAQKVSTIDVAKLRQRHKGKSPASGKRTAAQKAWDDRIKEYRSARADRLEKLKKYPALLKATRSSAS